MAAEKRKPERTPENKAMDPAPENKAGQVRPPGYWQYEQTGLLKPIVKRYLEGERLDPAELDIMREYCRQWIGSPIWERNPHSSDITWLEELRAGAAAIETQEQLNTWLRKAEDVGADPL